MRIMFVCHGNICRSPTAELVFKRLTEEKGCASDFTVASSATSTEEIIDGIGNPIYPPAAACLRSHGLSPEGKRAVQLTSADAQKYDLFVGMDSANVKNMHRILGKAAEERIVKLMDFTPRGGDVSDPWYTRRFDTAFADISKGCEGLLAHLTNESKHKN